MSALDPVTALTKAKKTPREIEDENQQTALSTLANGLAGKPSLGTMSAIKSGNEAVAQFANDQRAKAARMTAKGGALGQGSAVGMQNQVSQGVLGKLAETQANNNQLVSNEQKAYLDTAVNIGQQNKTLDENKRQFDTSTATQKDQFGQTLATNKEQFKQNLETNQGQFNANMEQRKSEFGTTSNLSQQQLDTQKTQFQDNLNLQKDQLKNQAGIQNIDALIKLGGDIPVVASKVLDQVLGNAGAPLSDQDKADLGKWYAEQKAKGEKLDAQTDTLIQAMVDQSKTTSALGALTATNATNDAVKQQLNGIIAKGEKLTPEQTEQAKTLGIIKQTDVTGAPTGFNGVKTYLSNNPSGLINIGGKVYTVKTGKSPDSGVGKVGQSLGVPFDYTIMEDQSGKTVYLYNGKIQDTPPK